VDQRNPEIVGPDLLLVTTEFDQWEIRDKKVADRLDVLFMAADGSPVYLGERPPVLADFLNDQIAADVRVPAAQKMLVVQGLELTPLG
jgi:hypothetical protein